jgi:peptide/nickel transport system ATP-binding protein
MTDPIPARRAEQNGLPGVGEATGGVPAPARHRDPLLRIRGLSVDYGFGPDAVHAVDHVDLDIGRGEVVGLAGESGSGKSTLAYAVTRLLREPGVIVGGAATFYDWPAGTGADAGRASGDPARIDLLSDDRRLIDRVRWSKIAVVFQSALHALNPVLRIGTLIDDVLQAHARGMSAGRRRERARELLAMVGISPDRLSSFPHQLSGGMRQRVMIALALALRPQLLIMDEPTTALDVVIQREILTELMDLRSRLGFSVLFITHDLSLLIEIADTIAVMYAGRLVEKAPARALFHAPRHPYTRGLTNSFPSLHGPRRVMTGIEGSPPDLRRVPVGCPFHPRCAWATPECSTRQPPDLLLAEACGDRRVLCHLQDGSHDVPTELAAPAPVWTGAAHNFPAPSGDMVPPEISGPSGRRGARRPVPGAPAPMSSHLDTSTHPNGEHLPVAWEPGDAR